MVRLLDEILSEMTAFLYCDNPGYVPAKFNSFCAH